MNELILITNGTVTVVGDVGSVVGIMAEAVDAATIPAVVDADGEVVTPAQIPEASTLMREVTPEELKAHPWRVPKARAERLETLRGLRDAKLVERDREANHAMTGRPGMRAVAIIETDRQVLRDMPPLAETALYALLTTDEIDAYLPEVLI